MANSHGCVRKLEPCITGNFGGAGTSSLESEVRNLERDVDANLTSYNLFPSSDGQTRECAHPLARLAPLVHRSHVAQEAREEELGGPECTCEVGAKAREIGGLLAAFVVRLAPPPVQWIGATRLSLLVALLWEHHERDREYRGLSGCTIHVNPSTPSVRIVTAVRLGGRSSVHKASHP
jgi:hypothetical protein